MPECRRYSIAIFIILMLISAPSGAMATLPPSCRDSRIEADSMVVDALLVRPLGIITTVAGFGLFLVSAPFSLLGRNAGQAWENLVLNPVRFTFVRPLGDFEATTLEPTCGESEDVA
jgi:hypothetical protein